MSIYRSDVTEKTSSGIEIRNGREENPRFRRIYSARVTDEVSIECEAYTMFGRSWSGNLMQRNGDAVYFDPQHPARKIIDRDLVPLVVERCNEMIASDNLYMKSNRPTVKSVDGTVWERQ